MKRFYTRVHVERAASGHQVFLDGRPLKTQGGRQQVVDSLALAEALASEWDGQGETIDPARFAYRDMADYALDTLPEGRTAAIANTFEIDIVRLLHDATTCRDDDPAALGA